MIPWDQINRLLNGERLKPYEVRILYTSKHAMEKAIKLVGNSVPTASIIKESHFSYSLTNLEEQKIAKALHYMNEAFEMLEKDLNSQLKAPSFEASAMSGENVVQTMKQIISMTMRSLQRDLK